MTKGHGWRINKGAQSSRLIVDRRSWVEGRCEGLQGYQSHPVSQTGLHVEAGHRWQQWGCAAPRTRCYNPSASDKEEYFGNLWYNLRHINKIPILKYLPLQLEFLWTLLI